MPRLMWPVVITVLALLWIGLGYLWWTQLGWWARSITLGFYLAGVIFLLLLFKGARR